VQPRHIVVEGPGEPELARPSLLTYSPAIVLLLVAILDIQRWADPDLWGHVAFGRAMLATRHLTLHDPYSYSAAGHLWLNHEWLSEAIMGATYNIGGVVGLKLTKFGCACIVIAALVLALSQIDSPISIQLPILLVAAIAIAPQMQFRPQMFTFAMLAALLAILTRFTYRGSSPMWAVVPMHALWANLHGGFIVGLAALAIFSVVRMTTDVIGSRGLRVGAWLLLFLGLAAASTFLTPYRFNTWRAVITALSNHHTGAVIVDWQPLMKAFASTWDANPVATLPLVAAIVMFVTCWVLVILVFRCGDSALTAIALVMTAAAIIAMRNVPLAVLACAVVIARHASGLVRGESPARPSRRGQGTVTALALAILIVSGLLSNRLRAGDPRPVGAIDFMLSRHLHGNIIAEFGWGEYVIWWMAPAGKVFIDGRYDTVYPASVIEDYLDFSFGRAKNFLDKYPHDFVLLAANDTLALESMTASPNWKQAYRDANCILFVRADSAAAKHAPIVVPASETPASFFP
jgi:hypothetical protein